MIAQVNPEQLQALNNGMVILFSALFLLFIGGLGFVMWLGWWLTSREGNPCPYTGDVLHRCDRLAYSAVESVHTFLNDLGEVDNESFDLRYAAYCPRTGRIFPDCVNMFGIIRVDWTFLNNRKEGRWTSWGSLSHLEREEILRYHDNAKGFQMKDSCIRARPEDIDAFHAAMRPGPLYVDMGTKVLLGWQCVPETTLEILIVRRPHYEYEFGLED